MGELHAEQQSADTVAVAEIPLAEPVRHQQVSPEASALLASEGESGRFEFKQTAKAVRPEVLCAAANWVAQDRSTRDKVTLLVGVEEVQDAATGLVTGRVVPGGIKLQQSVETIQNLVRETRPVPVDVRIIEEGAATPTPFLRLEIRPTSPPHYDAEGRRQTRNNASTRPLTGEELLDIYLDREAEKFEQRFQQTASEVLDGLAQVSRGVDELLDDLGYAGSAASEAVDEAQNSKFVAERIERSLEALHDQVEENASHTPIRLFFRLGDKRRDVWRAFANDAAKRPTKITDALIERLTRQLDLPIDGNAWLENLAELGFWDDVLDQRGEQQTMTWWKREIVAREQFTFPTVWPLDEEVRELRNAIARSRENEPKSTRKSKLVRR